MKISVVIPTLNSERYIARCIKSILSQDYPGNCVKIIVVDNGSTDDTLEILKRYGVNIIIDAKANIAKLRNLGANRSDGDIIAFLDSDCIASRSWLKNAVQLFQQDPKIGAVGGYYGRSDNPTWVEKAWCDLKRDVDGEVNFLSGGNLIVMRDVFGRISGFDEKLITGEDYELCQKIIDSGFKVISSSKLKVKHLGNVKTLLDIVKKERWYGLGMISSIQRKTLSKPLGLAMIYSMLILVLPISVLWNTRVALGVLGAFLVITIMSSAYMVRRYTGNRLKLFIKCIPIMCCYGFGRSLALLDIFKNYIKSKFARFGRSHGSSKTL